MVRESVAWDTGIRRHGPREGAVSPLHGTVTVPSHLTESQVPWDLDGTMESLAPTIL